MTKTFVEILLILKVFYGVIKITTLIYLIYGCKCAYVNMTVHILLSEDNLWELFFTSYCVGSLE